MRRVLAPFMVVMSEQRGRLALAALAGFMALGSGVGLLVTSAWLISAAALMPPVLTLQVAIVGVRFFGISRGVFRYTERLIGHEAALRGLRILRVNVVSRLATQGPAALPHRRRGEALVGIANDVDVAQDLPLRVVIPLLSAFSVGLAAVATASSFAPAAGVVLTVALTIVAVVSPALAWGAQRGYERDSAQARADIASALTDLTAGGGDILMSSALIAMQRDIDRAEAELAHAAKRRAVRDALGVALVQVSLGSAVAAMLFISIDALASGMDGRGVAVLALLPLGLLEAAAAIPAATLAFSKVYAAAERVSAVFDAPVTQPEQGRDSFHTSNVLAGKNVSAGWVPGQDVVSSLDFSVERGRILAVVGPSGSGKSTLVAALLRFIDHRGQITVDDVTLRSVTEDSLRATMTSLPQDVYLFSSTLRENLRLARPEATDDELLDALSRASLGPWVAALPDGLDTWIGAGGRGVSGGEQVRVGLARALVSHASIVVLDEPTEHLDDETAHAVMESVIAATQDKSVVLVTHRPFGLHAAYDVVRLT